MGPRAGLDGRKISPPTGIRSRTVQPVAQSLYRLSYLAHVQDRWWWFWPATSTSYSFLLYLYDWHVVMPPDLFIFPFLFSTRLILLCFIMCTSNSKVEFFAPQIIVFELLQSLGNWLHILIATMVIPVTKFIVGLVTLRKTCVGWYREMINLPPQISIHCRLW